jgi:hypothetical protein
MKPINCGSNLKNGRRMRRPVSAVVQRAGVSMGARRNFPAHTGWRSKLRNEEGPH